MNQLLNFYRTLRQINIGPIRAMCTKINPKNENEKLFFTIGQPTHETHPHILKNGEVVPFIMKTEFQERRQKLIEIITKQPPLVNLNRKRQIIVIPSATKQYMSDKIPYVFHQNTEFLYLTGCLEPDCCLVLTNLGLSSQPSSILFVREKDPHSELWDGPRTRPVDAIHWFGVDESMHMSELPNYLRAFLKDNKNFTLWYDFSNVVQPKVNDVINDLIRETSFKMIEAPNKYIHNLRLIKSPAEIKLMERTCDIASQAIIDTMTISKQGINEHEIYAKVDYECRKRGANYLAYPPVVAGGDRANIIHYINNNRVVKDNEMVLMDAGCYYHGYCSDITRTWPVNGKFTDPQKILYEALLEIQCKLIEICCDIPHLDSLFDEMCKMLGRKLQEVGLIGYEHGKESLYKMAFSYCPHHVSHYLGMDVHDTPTIRRNLKLKPGMVVTIEPGIYVNKNDKVPKEFHGLGLRIEDDVLITETGPIVLTKNCPKSVNDIERIACKQT